MRRIGLALLAFLLGGLPAPGHAAEAHAGKPVMGTVLQVTVEAEDEATARTLADQAVSIAARWDDILTTWRREGELARLNAQAGRGPFAASGELRTALGRMQRLVERTDGAFNPAVGTLVEAWRKPGAAPAARRVPDLAEALRIDRTGVILAPGVRLDAGAVGKGMALDAIVRVLVASGASALWIDFGGSSQLAWSQGRRPRSVAVAGLGKGVVHGTLELGDVALSTSRASGPGAEEGPIVDPRSGEPVRVPRLATVLCADATTADAWSTALVVLGRTSLEAVLASGCEALIEDEAGVVVTTDFWAARVTRRR
jgi:thiamine biosynthesis lipoprotein